MKQSLSEAQVPLLRENQLWVSENFASEDFGTNFNWNSRGVIGDPEVGGLESSVPEHGVGEPGG